MKNKNKFKEEDIRPKDLKVKIQKSLSSDVEFLLKNYSYFVNVNCPSCKKKSISKYLVKKKFNYLICNYCKTFFMSPRPNNKLLQKFYKRSEVYNFFQKYIFPRTEKVRSKKIFNPRLKMIIKICKQHKIKRPSLIEIGAGYGSFCFLAKKSKFFADVHAVEPTPDGAKNCKKKGIETHDKPIEILKIKKKYDLLVNFEVIEHLFSPKKFLIDSRKILKTGGFIILTCPNGMGFDIQILKTKSDSIDHEHLNYFNPNSITHLFESSGFSVLDVFTPGQLDVDLVRNKVIDRKFKFKNNELLKKILSKNQSKLRDSFQRFLIKNNLSSNMCIVARKK